MMLSFSITSMVSPSRSCWLKLLPMPTKSTTMPSRMSTKVVLMVVVMVMGRIMVARARKAQAAAVAEAAPVEAAPVAEAPGTAGELKLYDTDPRDAAMIMAIVADTLGKPLNQLRFKSIREVKEK